MHTETSKSQLARSAPIFTTTPPLKGNAMKRIVSIFGLLLALFASQLQARGLDDVDVILIRGYTSEVVFDKTMPRYGEPTFDSYWAPLDVAYWNYYKNTLLKGNKGRVVSFHWSSKDRLTGGVVRSMAERIKAEIDKGLCANKCVMITHSTGGLVGDYLISSAINSKGSSYDYKIIADKVAVVIHLASAAGGSELASIVRDVAYGVGCTNSITQTIVSWIFKGVNCGAGENSIGITNDLVPTRARQVNGSQFTYTPTLMLAGEGTAGVQGAVGNMLLPGNDDSVVAMHSTCGANSATPVDSCSPSVKPNGELASVSAPRGFYAAHYPWIMTGEDHGEMIQVQRELDPAARETLVTRMYGNFAETQSSTGWWVFKTNYRRITGDESKTSGQLIKQYFTF